MTFVNTITDNQKKLLANALHQCSSFRNNSGWFINQLNAHFYIQKSENPRIQAYTLIDCYVRHKVMDKLMNFVEQFEEGSIDFDAFKQCWDDIQKLNTSSTTADNTQNHSTEKTQPADASPNNGKKPLGESRNDKKDKDSAPAGINIGGDAKGNVIIAGDGNKFYMNSSSTDKNGTHPKPTRSKPKANAGLEKLRQPGEFRDQFVDALLDCHSIENAVNREHLISKLPKDIKRNISEPNAAPIIQVDEIVGRCLDYPNGIQSLIQAIESIEGNSLPLQKVKKLLSLAATTYSLALDPRPTFLIHITQQDDDQLLMRLGENSADKNDYIIPLEKIEHLFYNKDNNPSNLPENMFNQGFYLYENTLGMADERWKTAIQKDERLVFVLDAITSQLPWEALADQSAGFLERYQSVEEQHHLHPIVRKLRETGGKAQILRLEAPSIGFICAGKDPGYQTAITGAQPVQFQNQNIVNIVDVFDANQPWNALLAELQASNPAILHIIANGIGEDRFTADPETLTKDLEQFFNLFAQVPSIKLLMLCGDQDGDLMQAHYQLFERLSQETELETVVFIPSNPKNDSAVLFTSALYESLWRGLDLDQALATIRTQLPEESLEYPNQRRLPMTYQTNLTVNPSLESWLDELKEHYSTSSMRTKDVEQLIGIGYEIHLRLYEMQELLSANLPSETKISFKSEDIKTNIKEFQKKEASLHQHNYKFSDKRWLNSLRQAHTFNGVDVLTYLLEILQKNQERKLTLTRDLLEGPMETWNIVSQILNESPN